MKHAPLARLRTLGLNFPDRGGNQSADHAFKEAYGSMRKPCGGCNLGVILWLASHGDSSEAVLQSWAGTLFTLGGLLMPLPPFSPLRAPSQDPGGVKQVCCRPRGGGVLIRLFGTYLGCEDAPLFQTANFPGSEGHLKNVSCCLQASHLLAEGCPIWLAPSHRNGSGVRASCCCLT